MVEDTFSICNLEMEISTCISLAGLKSKKEKSFTVDINIIYVSLEDK